MARAAGGDEAEQAPGVAEPWTGLGGHWDALRHYWRRRTPGSSSGARTTLDINLAVKQLESIPRCELQRAGFVPRGRFSHSENWQGPDGTPVQFTDDPSLSGA